VSFGALAEWQQVKLLTHLLFATFDGKY
jgi:hypothetical protein